MIDDFIKEELECFQPMLQRQSLATDVERQASKRDC